MVLNTQTFVVELKKLFLSAQSEGKKTITINSGELHRSIGGYPGSNHRMPVCCSAMRSIMRDGDIIIESPPRGNGANFTIKYNLPR
jgi:5-methylcytosine-specific restriction protein A